MYTGRQTHASITMQTQHKHTHTCIVHNITVEPLNKGHFEDDINSADLFFVERFSSLGGSNGIVRVTLGS